MTKDHQIKLIRRLNSFYYEDGKLFEKCDSISKARKRSPQLRAKGYDVLRDRSVEPVAKPISRRGDAADRFLREALRRQQNERIAAENERRRGPNTLSLPKQDDLNTVMVDTIHRYNKRNQA